MPVVPEDPELPEVPEVPEDPELPLVPEVPLDPELPLVPEVPEDPELPFLNGSKHTVTFPRSKLAPSTPNNVTENVATELL